MEKVIARRYIVLLLVAVAAVAASYGVVKIPFLTSRKAILPRDAEVSKRLDRFLEKFGADSDLIVVAEGMDPRHLEAFTSELARRLRRLPTVRQAMERVDIDFFLRHAYLLVPAKRLGQFESVLRKLIEVPGEKSPSSWSEGLKRVEAWLKTPPPLSLVDIDIRTAEGGLRLALFFLEEWTRWLEAKELPDRIDWQRMVAKYGEGARLAAGGGYFRSRDGRMYFLFVRPRNPSSEFGAVAPFVEAVRREAESLASQFRSSGRGEVKVGLTGLPEITYEEFRALQRDIKLTVTTAAAFILLLVLLVLRSVKWALIVFVPMGLGVLLNTGLTLLTVGHLTMITSAFTAILFGMGVDYGIFLSTRIMEELEGNDSLERAVVTAVGKSARAVLTAGGATVLIFGLLTTVPFSGFSELGLVASSGVALVLACTFLLQPILFVLFKPTPTYRKRAPARGAVRRSGAMKIGRASSVALSVVAAAAAAAGAWAGMKIPFNYDVLALLPEGSEAAYYQRRMVAESDYQAEVLIFTARDIEEARRITEQAERLDTVAQVQSIAALFPPDAGIRLSRARSIGNLVSQSEYLKNIRALGTPRLDPEDMAPLVSSVEKTMGIVENAQEMAFSAGHKSLVGLLDRMLDRLERLQGLLEDQPERSRLRTQQFVGRLWKMVVVGFDAMENWKNARPLAPRDLPVSLRDRFVAADGTIAVYAFPAKSVYDPENLDRLMRQVEKVSKDVTGFPTTHRVFSHLAVDSFRQGSLLALAGAMVWILIAVRSLSTFVLALLPLVLGGGWMLGLLALNGMEFSYANIIALPLVMGLAVDYGVWFAHRWSELPGRNAWTAARLASRAVLLAAGTTLAGLGAITLASYRGVSTLGITVTVGLLCCVAAALVAAPAFAAALFGRKR